MILRRLAKPAGPLLTTMAALMTLVGGPATGQDKPDISKSSQGNQGSVETMRRLVEFAKEAVKNDSAYIGRLRFSISTRTRVYFLDTSPLNISTVLSPSDQFGVPIEALLREEVFQRDFAKALPSDTFWQKPLAQVTLSVQACVAEYSKLGATGGARELSQKCVASIEQSYSDLKKIVEQYAMNNHLRVAAPTDRGPATGYRVKIVVRPPGPHVKIMTLLEYRKCEAFNEPMEHQWIELLSETNLIGRYRYRVEWPARLNGVDESEFEVKEAETLTFTPKRK